MSELTASRTLYVRTDGDDTNNGLTSGNAFETPAKAVAASKEDVHGIYRTYVDVGEGTFDCDTLLPGCREGSHIHWTGNATAYASRTANNFSSSTANMPDARHNYFYFNVFIPANSAAVNRYVIVKTATGGTNPHLLLGCHEIISWDPGMGCATLKVIRAAGVTAMPSVETSANMTVDVTVVNTVLSFSDHGIYSTDEYHAGTWDGMVLVGDFAHHGVFMRGGTRIILGSNFGTSHWASNLISQSRSAIFSAYTAHSYSLSYNVTVDGGGFVSLVGSILSGCYSTPIRVFNGGLVDFSTGQVLCGGYTYCVFAMRGGSIIATDSSVKGCKPSGSIAYYATSAGTVIATGTTDDAETSYATGASPGGNGASVCH